MLTNVGNASHTSVEDSILIGCFMCMRNCLFFLSLGVSGCDQVFVHCVYVCVCVHMSGAVKNGRSSRQCRCTAGVQGEDILSLIKLTLDLLIFLQCAFKFMVTCLLVVISAAEIND